jgi:MoxR-like ATPase
MAYSDLREPAALGETPGRPTGTGQAQAQEGPGSGDRPAGEGTALRQTLEPRVAAGQAALQAVRGEIARVVVGQGRMVDRLLIALLCNGHVLIEGVPGLAKTLTVTTLARTVRAGFQRIQFTPDLLPADLTGTLIYNPKTQEFVPRKGPLFTNIVLADEINRAPAKVQSALLEAMQERQVTIGDTTYPLDDPFMVLATQNPIEQEGTYPLPEAQTDRFMLKLAVSYPSPEEELEILRRMARNQPPPQADPVIGSEEIRALRAEVDQVYVDPKIEEYIVNLVDSSRHPRKRGLPLDELIQYGASPRASIYLALTAKAHALLAGRGYVTPLDVKSMAPDVLRHRILLSYEAEAQGLAPETLVERILDGVEVP